MPRTLAEEAEYQRLGKELGFLNGPEPVAAQEPPGFLGFAGKTFANILPGAAEKSVQMFQGLLNLPTPTSEQLPLTHVPNFFDTPAPQGAAQHIVAGAGELAEYLPSMLMGEGAGAAGLSALGAGTRAAKIGGAALGFGLPMAPEGGETVAVQSGVGALQNAAMDMGWKGKLGAGIIGGLAGYYEGQKQSPEVGAVFGALNLLGPTLIDPALNRILGANKAAAAAGREAEIVAPPPHQPAGSSNIYQDVPGFPLGAQPKPINRSRDLIDIGGGRPIEGQPAPLNVGLPAAPELANLQLQRQQGLPIGQAPMTSPTRFRRMDYPPESSKFGGLMQLPVESAPPRANLFDYGGGLSQIEPPNPPTFPGDQGLMMMPRNIEPRFGGLTDIGAVPQISHPTERNGIRGFQSETGFGPSPEISALPAPAPVANLQKPSRFLAPEGATVPEPTQEGAHVIASAVKRGRKIYVSEQRNAPHEKIGIEHGLTTGVDSVPEDQRGFLVQNADGSQGFANRKRAAKIAFKAGQIKEPTALLKSESPWTMGESTAVRSIDTPTPIAVGDSHVHWSETGMPLDINVTKVEDGIIHYTELDFMTGQSADKVASLQEFEQLQKHPSERGAPEIKAVAAAPPIEPPPSPPKSEPVRPAAQASASASKKFRIFSNHIEDSTKTIRASFGPPHEDSLYAEAGWNEKNAIVLENIVNLTGRTGSGKASEVLEGIKDLAAKEGKAVLLQPIPSAQKAQLKAWYSRHGFEDYGDYWVWKPDIVANLQTVPSKVEQVRIKGKYGLEIADIVGREGNTLHLEVQDPIFGARKVSVLRSDVMPMPSEAPPTPKHGRPFEDVPGAANQLDRADERYGGEGGMLQTVLEGAEPGATKKTLPGRQKTVLSIIEGLKKLSPEAATIIGEILHRLQVASGQTIDVSLAQKMVGAKGGMYEMSGKIALNLQWINQVVQHWDKLSEINKGNALMRIAALFGHEITHVAQKFGERSGLQIDGVPLIKAIMTKVEGMTVPQKQYVIKQIMDAKGDPSKAVSLYLSGDIDAVYGYYKRMRPNLTREGAVELAAGEFMAEVGAVELVKRMEVKGLPNMLRSAIDKFKQVLVNTIKWFKEQNDTEGVAALQSLSDIANKMYDHFAAGDTAALHKAYPASSHWPAASKVNPFASVPPPPIASSVAVEPFLKMELARLGVRAGVGATLGGVIGPTVSDHQLSLAESVIAGGVLGAFGPVILKTVMNGQAAQELIAAAKQSKGNPFASLQVLMGGKNLKQLGAEARYGWRGDGSFVAKIVRSIESEFNLNLDPKNRAIIEQARGLMGEQFALIEDALKKASRSRPSQGVKDATVEFIEGRIDKDQYRALLTDDAAKTYGNFMIAARESTSIATDLIASGMRKSKFRDTIIENREKYVGRFYKAYRDGEFDMKYFDKVKQDFMDLNPGVDIHNADALLREHMVEIKANRKMFSGKRGTGAQAFESKIQFRRRATEEEIYMQQLEVGALEHNSFSPEYKAAKAKLDWMEQHKITDNWRGWLGEIKDPTERMIYTFQKVYPSSIAGKIFDLFDNSIDSIGNKFAYSGSELTNTRQLLQSEIAKAGADVASLQKRLQNLEAYTPLPEGAAYGKIGGKFTDRFVRDSISTYDTPYKWMDQPIIRGIAVLNTVVKINRTVLNPLTVIRNYLQVPMFMLMARVSPQEIWQAAQVIHKGANPELLSILRQRHVLGVDYATEELSANLGHIVSGHFDSDAAVRIAKAGYGKAREFYQQPDMLVRAGAFISAQKRLAERMKLSPNHASVIDAAVEAADRVTMNYATVPRAVKAARQLPFVSLFVSYTSEITKILKNLTEDAISSGTHLEDRMHAVGMLGAMATLPALLTAGFEGNLSTKDRADWQKLRRLQPDYARARFYLPLSREADGRFRYMDMTNMIPADNYTQMMKSALQGDMEAARAANPFFALQDTPLLNIATEQISGIDLRTGKPVEGGYARVKEVLKEILPPTVPPGYEGTRLMNAFSENKQGGLGLTNLRTGVETRPGDIIANYLTGMRFANVQLSTVQQTAISQAQQSIAHEQQHLRETMNMNVSDDKKIQARNLYSKSVQEIMLQLHSRIGR